ncbi:RecQ helicase TLH3 [Metarhizium guizhouense ARSEF 977]|uniref:RecQ helicase TLH3 n=1 Tax=Metarhizium guizhouense (strain ARSEF 977) TaxID=1276136 RepID=A0A0B4GIP1_METGA|nr:RecQ helicase TLH3 [Metarhizium guizhouense ARSEF 977]
MQPTACAPDMPAATARGSTTHCITRPLLESPESAVICTECGFALKADGDRVSRHLGEKHGLSRKTRWGLNKLINSLQLPDPRQLPPRQDGCPQHPHLALQSGAACSYCRFRSTSHDLLSRHLKKEHRREVTARRSSGYWLRDHIQDDVLFQSWLPAYSGSPGCEGRPSTLQSSARPSPRTAWEPLSPILVSNWMRRTGWEAIFANANRRLLIALYQTPMKVDGPYYLGAYDGKPIESPASDEARLRAIVHALDRLFDRCADTVTHTDTAIRRWVHGRFVDRPYKAPFQLVAHERSERQYRRLLKRCVCMSLRLWRIPRSTARALTKRTITYEQDQALRKLWDDPVWSETATTTGQDSKVEDVENSCAREWGGKVDGILTAQL